MRKTLDEITNELSLDTMDNLLADDDFSEAELEGDPEVEYEMDYYDLLDDMPEEEDSVSIPEIKTFNYSLHLTSKGAWEEALRKPVDRLHEMQDEHEVILKKLKALRQEG